MNDRRSSRMVSHILLLLLVGAPAPVAAQEGSAGLDITSAYVRVGPADGWRFFGREDESWTLAMNWEAVHKESSLSVRIQEEGLLAGFGRFLDLSAELASADSQAAMEAILGKLKDWMVDGPQQFGTDTVNGMKVYLVSTHIKMGQEQAGTVAVVIGPKGNLVILTCEYAATDNERIWPYFAALLRSCSPILP